MFYKKHKNICNICNNNYKKSNLIWILSLYGTAIGAGVLFLPINIGINGLFSLLIIMIIAFPMAFFSHRGLTRFVLSSKKPNKNLFNVIHENFNKQTSFIFILFYFFSIYPILLIYSTAITNTVMSFIIHQLNIAEQSRVFVSFILISVLMGIIILGEKVIIKFMSFLVIPFILSLIFFSFYIIQFWNYSLFYEIKNIFNLDINSLLKIIWYIIPVTVFSFNHSPIISSFAVFKKRECSNCCEKTCSKILFYSNLLMIFTVIFFVFSCILSVPREAMQEAKDKNLSVLSYFSIYFEDNLMNFLGPIIAIIAIIKSFFGHYLGAKESINKILMTTFPKLKNKKRTYLTNFTTNSLIFTSSWIIAIFNPSILNIIEAIIGPIISIILFLIPAYSIYKVPNMKRYKKEKFTNLFLFVIGIFSFLAMMHKLIIF
ncbi:sdaC [Wigglesworthia glossinidia endosymbiont of Glossina brevipalpis]|uniref:SdaC protein n=1 Tax=Wigglesworthia glossinidia brevipalpis TaxID=36870 RepID=Q8D261_WIGBR|nr:sdaC [Wigglesworthia glossinidia endosymbiont of Glossina brevipalpis]